MNIAARFFRWHRWLAYLVGVQLLAWMLGGLVFAWVPFQAWIKGGDALVKPQQALPAGWAQALAAAPTGAADPVLSLRSVATAGGPALLLRRAGGAQWLAAAGGDLPRADAASVGRFARSLYRGPGALADVQRLDQVPSRLGIVRELGERQGVWRARFDDALATRMYFDGRSGEFLAVRNDSWVLYDFFWRLHVMDYREGEDFNNTLLRASATAAFALLATGAVLVTLALRRAWRRRREARPRAVTP